jgi:hypothetical protein
MKPELRGPYRGLCLVTLSLSVAQGCRPTRKPRPAWVTRCLRVGETRGGWLRVNQTSRVGGFGRGCDDAGEVGLADRTGSPLGARARCHRSGRLRAAT